jgi:hypothetical protein
VEDYVIAKCTTAITNKRHVEYSGWHLDHGQWTGFRSAGLSFITSVFGQEHTYYKEFETVVGSSYVSNIEGGVSILQSIKYEIEQGWLTSIKNDVYKQLVKKQVTAWADLRNNAAMAILISTMRTMLKV